MGGEKEEKPKRVDPRKGQPRKMTPAILANPGGRPSEFDVAAPKIIQYIRRGNTYKCAAGCARVSYETFNLWINKGKESLKNGELNCKFLKFLKDVENAETECEQEIVSHWLSEIPGNWQAGRDFLARRYSASWGAKDKIDLNANVEVSQKSILEIPDNGRRKVD